MAPEQVLTPGEITDRCDVYLLGLLLYRLIAGRSPYTAESASQFLMAHAFEAPIPLSSVRADTGASLAAVVHACLEKSPSARPAMADVAAVLECRAASSPSSPRTPRARARASAPRLSPTTHEAARPGDAFEDRVTRSRISPVAHVDSFSGSQISGEAQAAGV
jgi:serine/threonine-protein kinase